MIVQIVRFRSDMTDAEVRERYRSRSDRYLEVPGLLQKYYLAFPTGEHGAVYVWESEEDVREFRDSDLGRTIASAYKVRGEPSVETVPVVFALRPQPTTPTAADSRS